MFAVKFSKSALLCYWYLGIILLTFLCDMLIYSASGLVWLILLPALWHDVELCVFWHFADIDSSDVLGTTNWGWNAVPIGTVDIRILGEVRGPLDSG